jgi:hypothetical protein
MPTWRLGDRLLGEGVDRLRTIKAKYDPNNVVRSSRAFHCCTTAGDSGVYT